MKKLNQTKPTKDNKVIIGDEWMGNDNVEFICDFCSRVLIKLVDRNRMNISYFCSFCKIPFDPSQTEIRKKSKLETPNKNVEPAVSTTPGIPDISIHHTPPIRGGLAELQKKGIKITSYKTSEKD